MLLHTAITQQPSNGESYVLVTICRLESAWRNDHSDVSMALDCSIDVQQDIQPQAALENVLDTFLAQDIQSQEMRTSFNKGTKPSMFLKLDMFKFALKYLVTKMRYSIL